MKLAELVDIENQILQDYDKDPVQLHRRDRQIGQALEPLKNDRERLFIEWLRKVQPDPEYSPGRFFETGHRWFRYLLVLMGLIVGITTSASLLAYDGSSPVNVVNFLAVIVIAQLITLIFFMINCLPGSVKKLIPASGEFYRFVKELGYLVSKIIGKLITHLPQDKLKNILTDLDRLKTRHKLYGVLEKWLIAGLTQRFGVAFNFGAIATCLYLITFSDIAFAWNTTLNIQSKTFYQIIETISYPWHSVFPQGVPSLELIQASRYFRLEGEYLGLDTQTDLSAAQIVGDWWRFLVLCTLVYGLLPRVCILFFASIRTRYFLAKLPYTSADFESLYDRLIKPVIQTRGEETSVQSERTDFEPARPDLHRGQTCVLILWGELDVSLDEIKSLIGQKPGWIVDKVYSAGSYDVSIDENTFQSLTHDKAIGPILILVESWEAPSKAILFFIKRLRKLLSNKQSIVVGLLNTETQPEWQPPLHQDYKSWSKTLASLNDPYLRVEPIMEEL